MLKRSLYAGACLLSAFSLALPATAGTKYSYDSAGRLIQVEYSSGVTIRYAYDAAGNRREIATTQIPNRAPVAINDNASVQASASVDIYVLANDSDADRNALTITGVSSVSGGGTPSIVGGSYIRFTAPTSSGAKAFTYTISDGKGGTATATVTVTVAEIPNRAPIAVDDSVTVVASGSVDIYVRANDSDPDGDALTVTSVSAVNGGGTATVSGSGTYIQFTAPATAGSKTFTYTISDGKGASATATVTVTVTPPANRPPVATNDSVGIIAGNTEPVMVLANDSDPDGHPLTIIAVGGDTGSNAQIAPGGMYINYTAPLMPATRTFTYTISDGHGGTSTATVTVTVMPGIIDNCDPWGDVECTVDPF